jgi:hypothetical protein
VPSTEKYSLGSSCLTGGCASIVCDAELVDRAVESIGDAAHMPPDAKRS